MKKIPVSFNDEEITKVAELATLMGISGVYGDFPKALKFGINLALAAIKNPEKVYTTLEPDEMDIYFKSISHSEKIQRLERKSKEMLDQAQKV